MGYFKDWQKGRRNIRESMNRLPGEQPQKPKAYITNSRQNVTDMEREYLIKRLREFEDQANKGVTTLSVILGPRAGFPGKPGLVSTKGNPALQQEFRRLSIYLGSISRGLQQLIPSLEQPLSQELPPQSQLPPSEN